MQLCPAHASAGRGGLAFVATYLLYTAARAALAGMPRSERIAA